MKGGNINMEETRIIIPRNHSILQIWTVRNDFIEIRVIKVRNHKSVAKYISYIKPEDSEIQDSLHLKRISYKEFKDLESIDTVIPRALDIIGSDTIIYMNSEKQLELLKSKCASLGIDFNNNIIDGNILTNQIPEDIRGFISNSLELLT